MRYRNYRRLYVYGHRFWQIRHQTAMVTVVANPSCCDQLNLLSENVCFWPCSRIRPESLISRGKFGRAVPLTLHKCHPDGTRCLNSRSHLTVSSLYRQPPPSGQRSPGLSRSRSWVPITFTSQSLPAQRVRSPRGSLRHGCCLFS